MKCINCGRDRHEATGTVVKLSEEERTFIEKAGGGPALSEVFYCSPCYRVITDRELGARLISGQLEMRLRLAGHPRAQQVGEALYKFLIEKSQTKQVS